MTDTSIYGISQLILPHYTLLRMGLYVLHMTQAQLWYFSTVKREVHITLYLTNWDSSWMMGEASCNTPELYKQNFWIIYQEHGLKKYSGRHILRLTKWLLHVNLEGVNWLLLAKKLLFTRKILQKLSHVNPEGWTDYFSSTDSFLHVKYFGNFPT